MPACVLLLTAFAALMPLSLSASPLHFAHLSAIKDRHLLPPLMILQILSQNPNKQLSVVKDYIIHSLQEESDFIKADQEEIQRFQMETMTMREEIQRLHTQSGHEAHAGMHEFVQIPCVRRMHFSRASFAPFLSSSGRSPSRASSAINAPAASACQRFTSCATIHTIR